MKKSYISPEIIVSPLAIDCMEITDSKGIYDGDDFTAKENNFIFDDDDNFGDTWGEDTNNLWGDEE